jgi:hypothetical protein
MDQKDKIQGLSEGQSSLARGEAPADYSSHYQTKAEKIRPFQSHRSHQSGNLQAGATDAMEDP